MVDEYHTALAKHLVNFHDLNRILKSEIFLHKDGQLKAAHVILGYKPSTKCFQSLKNVIKACDTCLALIDVAVLGFLLIGPPPEGTQDAQIPTPIAAKLLYSQEPPLPSAEEADESTFDSIQEVTDKDFKVFHRSDALNASQASSSTTMGFEEKTPDLLALLSAHTRGFSLVVTIPPHPPTLAATCTSSAKVAEKK